VGIIDLLFAASLGTFAYASHTESWHLPVTRSGCARPDVGEKESFFFLVHELGSYGDPRAVCESFVRAWQNVIVLR